jgi:hypothetical protein
MSRAAFVSREMIENAGPDSPLRALVKQRASPRPLEFMEQSQLIAWADDPANRLRYPELEGLMHVPNGGKRTKAVAAKLKATGVRPGYPDLVLDAARGRYHGWRGELKVRGGRPSELQLVWHERLRLAGYRVDVVIGWEAMRDRLVDYLSLPLAVPSIEPVTRTLVLTCHAPHPDQRRMREACGRTLYTGAMVGHVEFATTASDAPEGPESDGTFWLQCPRKQCSKWNRFRFVVAPRRVV